MGYRRRQYEGEQGVDYLEATRRRIFPQEMDCRERAEQRLRSWTGPSGTLGEVGALAVDLAGMTGVLPPPVSRKTVVLFAGDHGGLSREGALRLAGGLADQVRACVRGEAMVSHLARRDGVELVVVDAGLEEDLPDLAGAAAFLGKKIGRGTADMGQGPAMSRTHAVLAVEAGIELARSLAEASEVIGIGVLGEDAIPAALALGMVLTGGAGTGSGGPGGEKALSQYWTRATTAVALHHPDARDALDVLTKVGGFELGMAAGLILGGVAQRRPVVVDGLAALAAGVLACRLEPFVRDYLLCARSGIEPGYHELLAWIGRRPLLGLLSDQDVGAGAVLSLPVLEAAAGLLF